MTHSKVLISGMAMMLGLGWQGAAEAQTAPADAAHKSDRLEEVVVTARRVDESLQITPVAVTALSAESIVERQVVQLTDLQHSTPNLTVTTGAPSSGGFAFVTIRGQTNQQPGMQGDPAIGIYVDGVYIPRAFAGLFNLDDISRMEVLRGPQGTLFGRNTNGGAVNILTADPTATPGGSVHASFGNYSDVSAGFTLNGPLSGSAVTGRLTYEYGKHDGYGENRALHRPVGDELGSHLLRGKLKIAPEGAAWDLMLEGDYNRQRDSGQIITLKGIDPNVSAAALSAGGVPAPVTLAFLAGFNLPQYVHSSKNWYDTNGTGYAGRVELPFDKMDAYGGSATLHVGLGWGDVKSITAYRHSANVGFIDLDATPLDALGGESGYHSNQVSEELQLSGTQGAFNYITGLYYSRETGTEYSDFQAFAFANEIFQQVFGLPVPNAAIGRNDGDAVNVSKGIFVQTNYKFSDRLRGTAGLRWTKDDREVKLHNVTVSGAPGDLPIPLPTGGSVPNCVIVPDDGNPGHCTQTESTGFSYPAWTAGLDFQATDNLFLYAKTSGAAMAGGWNLRVGSVPAFKPEKVKDVELGLKTDALDHRLRTNLALFHSWQTDVQRNVGTVVTSGGQPVSTQYVANSGNAQINGLELEVTALPWNGMEITASAGLESGKYDKGTYNETQVSLLTGQPVAVDRSGEPLPVLAKQTFSLGATQTVPLAAGKLSMHLDYSYVSSRVWTSGTTYAGSPTAPWVAAANALGVAPGYGLLNGRVALHLDHPNLELALYGKNLTNKQYVTRTFADLYAAGFGYATEFVGLPRLFGVKATYYFGN